VVPRTEKSQIFFSFSARRIVSTEFRASSRARGLGRFRVVRWRRFGTHLRPAFLRPASCGEVAELAEGAPLLRVFSTRERPRWLNAPCLPVRERRDKLRT